MKVIISLALCFVLTKGYNQTDTASTLKEYDGWKKGSGTFSLRLTVQNLEKYVTGKYSVKKFESTLGDYDKQWYGSDTVRENNKVVLIDMPYAFKPKEDEFDVLHIRYNVEQVIQSITFFTKEDDLRVNKIGNFINHIKASGYEFDLRSARLSERFGSYTDRRRLIYRNRVKKITIAVLVVEYDREYEISLYRN